MDQNQRSPATGAVRLMQPDNAGAATGRKRVAHTPRIGGILKKYRPD
jgi:hypothetical protein